MDYLAELAGIDLPLPGSGATWDRFTALARLASRDTVLGRLAEAHFDAVAINAELGGPDVAEGNLWGVWAAEDPSAVLTAAADGTLSGRKNWCSGASICTHALVTVQRGDTRALYAVDLRGEGVRPVPDTWHAVGMADSDSGAVDFDHVPAVMVGEPGEYLSRPGFWHGAIGVAACWFGSATGLVAPLRRRVAKKPDEPYAAAHLGSVAVSLTAAQSVLHAAAADIDADPDDKQGEGRARALAARATVEKAATEVLDHVGRALGAAPLCADAAHAQRVADLTVYLRQSHAERDLAQLGRDIVDLSDGARLW